LLPVVLGRADRGRRDIRQAITELVNEVDAPISTIEFHTLNLTRW
jgi:hypothetical protein